MPVSPIKTRNNTLFDNWSLLHLSLGIALGWLMSPIVALVGMVLWEPVEIFVLSPFLTRFGIVFGYETLRNSLSDITFDVFGVLFGAYVLGHFVRAPFHLF